MNFRCYNNYMIEENDSYKVTFHFLSPNVLLLFVFKIASWNVFFFLRNSVLCIWLSYKSISLIFKLLKIKLFWQIKKLKHVRNVVVVIILVVVVIVCTFCWTNISAAMSEAGFHNPLHNQLHSPRHICCGDVTIKVIWFKKLTFILTGCREYFYICACMIWVGMHRYDNFGRYR